MNGFPFATIEPNQLGQVTKWDVPLNDWVGLKFGNGHNDTFGNAISRATEDFIWDDDNPVRPDVLNRSYGIEGQLKFDKPLSAQRARLMHERKRKELESLAYVESASHSWASAKAAIGFGASLVGGLSHPVDLGLAFLPFIGSEKAAAGVAKMGGGAFRQTVARGLVAEEALALPGGRLTAAVIDGVVNQAIVEIPVAIQKHRDQAIYGLEDSAFNILAGGAFAGALKGLGLALERAGKLWRDADPRIREAALMDVAKTILTGESPRVHEYFGLDEATIAQRVEAKVRAEFPFEEPSVKTDEPLGLNRPEREDPRLRKMSDEEFDAEFRSAKQQVDEAEKAFDTIADPKDLTNEQRAAIGKAQDRWASASLERLRRNYSDTHTEDVFAKMTELADRGSESAFAQFRVLAEVLQQRAGITPGDATGIYRFLPQELLQNPNWQEAAGHRYAKLVEWIKRVQQAATETAEATTSIRDQSINDFLAKAKADHEARLQGVIDHETRRVLDEIKTRTPQTPQEDIDRYVVKGTPDDASIEAVNKDAADMAEQALNVARTPEERVALKAQIDKELAEVVTGEKAIDHMIPCVTQRAKV